MPSSPTPHGFDCCNESVSAGVVYTSYFKTPNMSDAFEFKKNKHHKTSFLRSRCTNALVRSYLTSRRGRGRENSNKTPDIHMPVAVVCKSQ